MNIFQFIFLLKAWNSHKEADSVLYFEVILYATISECISLKDYMMSSLVFKNLKGQFCF